MLSTVLLGAGLTVAAAMLAVTNARSVQSTLDAGAIRSAQDIAALVDAGQLPDPVPTVGEGTLVVQVVDANGRIRAASAGADRLVSLLPPDQLRRAEAGERFYVDGERIGLAGLLRVAAVRAGPRSDPRTVVVGVGATGVRDSMKALRTGLLVGAPLLLGLLALLNWRLIGWTLRPVEALRRGAAEITGTAVSRRLPLPEAHDEIHRLAATLNDMLGRLEAAGARQRSFVSDAAHELRSPLASLRTQLEVAERHGRAAETIELAGEALIDIDRLARLVDDLLLLARLDEGAPRRTRREAVDLHALATEVVGRYKGARVPVRLAASAAVPAVSGDPDGLGRVLANLLDNAVRHAESAVRVEVTGVDGRVALVVADDGPGVPAAERDRVFDRFTRLDEARGRASGGVGLGLAIVRELVRAHAGVVTLADGQPGLRVVVSLPAAPAAP
jgi:signal transduction histidine kinase